MENGSCFRLRPYHDENTGSRPITDVAASGLLSTWMGDRLGTAGVVDIFTFVHFLTPI